MTTLDDKILGEKLQYYYSSSEDEESDHEEDEGQSKTIRDQEVLEAEIEYSPDGSAVNTGPKGVINDWRKYKQLETEQRVEQQKEMERLIKKLSMTCKSHLDEEMDKEKQKQLQDKLNGKVNLRVDEEEEEDEDDETFLQQYRLQRMEEMRRQLSGGRRFEQVINITSGEEFLHAIDEEGKGTLVLVHIFEPDVPACQAMEGSLLCLALQYPQQVKFCQARGSVLGTSTLFRSSALPALLLYRGGELVGNLVRVSDQLGDDFYATDVEALLQEYGLLPEKHTQANAHSSIRNAAVTNPSDSDSDLDID
ncbi:phosducin-like protein [Astyanax mexicanus]|uniref:Phosducin-like protein n=1 Tax=Astyanax mexicanus TaxID=7994 RepID=A0A8T2L4C3_ASTMX|nr:phosducin-like protein [Astyanax mexicanus]